MLRKLLSTALIMFVPFILFAQGSISGVVTDATTGETMPGANVIITELSTGASTNVDGEYTINNVPSGTYTITATFLGFKRNETTVQVGSSNVVVNFDLEPDYFGLEDIVVTGVGQGTETTKLGFSVGKVSEQQLAEVPASNPASALRGKVTGVTIVQASGDPSSAPSIRLRGSTSLGNNQDPLIILDGVITSGTLQDINMNDVQSIEVVKGAAASSLYGSLAGNGVIQVITKRNANKVREPELTIRSEYGISEIAKDYPLATKHPWDLDNNLVVSADGKYIEQWDGYDNYDADRRFDNDYPIPLYDNVDAIFTGNPYTNNSVSLANSGELYNYRVSYDNFVQGGVIEPVDSYNRNTVRFNANFTPNDRLDASISTSYIKVDAPEIGEQGQGSNYFYSALTAEPFINFLQTDADGNYINNGLTGYDVQSSNFHNPMYVAQEREQNEVRDRIIAGFTINYAITDNLSINGSQSLDKRYQSNTTFYPKGYQTPGPSVLNDGFDGRTKSEFTTAISELWLEYNQEFDDFNLNTTLKYLYEDREVDQVSLSGRDYVVPGIRSISSTDSDTYSIGSYSSIVRAENFFLNVDVDYLDKIIASGLIRRDGSSGFGSEERWQTYYRASLAYRITEDFDIEGVNEWKVRASYGTSGQRPPFSAQYETYNASSSGISPGILGNNQIKPSTVGEFEVGTNLTFLDRYNLEVNYAMTNVENDYLLVPLSSTAGFSAQWQNVGEIESTSFEVGLSGALVDTRDFSWNSTLTWSKVTQEVTNLGGVPPFTRSAGGAIDLFRFEAGVPYGTMYGNKAIKSLDDLTVVNGEVVNAGVDVTGDGVLTRDDYEINGEGYVVLKGTHGNGPADGPLEQIVYAVDEDGAKILTSIGNTNPDFQLGFSNSLNFKGLGLYVLLDWVQGADVYNYTKQLLIFNDRHKIQQKHAEQGYDVSYTNSSSQIYNGASSSSYFVEDASFLKVREIALSYTLGERQLGSLGNHVSEIKLSVTGRNLLTFTSYSGFDPEVALRSNSTNFRLDEYAYPNFRTFTGAIQVRF